MRVEEAEALDVLKYGEYRNAMRVLKARETLLQLKITCAPDLKKHARSEMYRKLNKEAFPEEHKPIKTVGELMRYLNG